jgi:uncharacterized protein (TIGR02246 family)
MYSGVIETCRPVAAEVRTLLYELAEAYYDQDLPRLLALYAADSQTVLVGSTAGERRVGLVEIRQAYERDFIRSGRVCVEYGKTSISTRDDTAWAAAECLVHMTIDGEEYSLPGQLTVVCENRDGQWLIVQQHFSLAAAL